MSRIPDANSLPSGGLGAGAASGAPQAASPSKPAGAVDIIHSGLSFLYEAAQLANGRRCPVNPPFFIGCGFGVAGTVWASGTHTGVDLYKTPNDVAVDASCDFMGTGVGGGNVYPGLAGCSHQGTPGKAKVIAASDMGTGIGNCIILEHMDSAHLVQIRTVYMHLGSIAVSVGQFVATTDVLGTVGHSGGYATINNHLHFEMWAKQSSHPEWRVVAEVLPSTIQAARPGAVDPAIWFPDCFPSDEISIADVWILHARFPANGGVQGTCIYCTVPIYHVDIYGTNAVPMTIYPFLDGPGGLARVLLVEAHRVVILHQMTPTTVFVTVYGIEIEATFTPAVSPGDWVDLNTALGVIEGSLPGFQLFVIETPVVAGESQTFDEDWLAAHEASSVCPSNYFGLCVDYPCTVESFCE